MYVNMPAYVCVRVLVCVRESKCLCLCMCLSMSEFAIRDDQQAPLCMWTVCACAYELLLRGNDSKIIYIYVLVGAYARIRDREW
jgi:hypothetical protein